MYIYLFNTLCCYLYFQLRSMYDFLETSQWARLFVRRSVGRSVGWLVCHYVPKGRAGSSSFQNCLWKPVQRRSTNKQVVVQIVQTDVKIIWVGHQQNQKDVKKALGGTFYIGSNRIKTKSCGQALDPFLPLVVRAYHPKLQLFYVAP